MTEAEPQYCQQCSIEKYDEDLKDFEGLVFEDDFETRGVQ